MVFLFFITPCLVVSHPGYTKVKGTQSSQSQSSWRRRYLSGGHSVGWQLAHTQTPHQKTIQTHHLSVCIPVTWWFACLCVRSCVCPPRCLRWMSLSGSHWRCDCHEMQTDLTGHQSCWAFVCACLFVCVKNTGRGRICCPVCRLLVRWFNERYKWIGWNLELEEGGFWNRTEKRHTLKHNHTHTQWLAVTQRYH